LTIGNAGRGRIVQEVSLAVDDEILVDARGHRCPVPTLRLRRAMEAAGPGARVRLLADDPLARIDVPHLAAARGWTVLGIEAEGPILRFLVQA
jgi:tRNA 2-thiouridine synthesizing protein A